MAELFETLKVSWDGKDYEIMPTLELVGRVENVITATELFSLIGRGAMPFAKLSMAFGIILRSAGCRATDEEIYAGMFSGDEDKNSAGGAVSALLAMMSPKITESDSKKKPRPSKGATKQ